MKRKGYMIKLNKWVGSRAHREGLQGNDMKTWFVFDIVNHWIIEHSCSNDTKSSNNFSHVGIIRDHKMFWQNQGTHIKNYKVHIKITISDF